MTEEEQLRAQFDSIVEEKEREGGPVRLVVLENPTHAQLSAIPLGVDMMVVDADQGAILSGVWHEEARGGFIERAVEHGHIHAYLGYVPPAPTPDSALTPQQIAENIAARYTERLPGQEREIVHAMIREAVLTAREGMVWNPF